MIWQCMTPFTGLSPWSSPEDEFSVNASGFWPNVRQSLVLRLFCACCAWLDQRTCERNSTRVTTKGSFMFRQPKNVYRCMFHAVCYYKSFSERHDIADLTSQQFACLSTIPPWVTSSERLHWAIGGYLLSLDEFTSNASRALGCTSQSGSGSCCTTSMCYPPRARTREQTVTSREWKTRKTCVQSWLDTTPVHSAACDSSAVNSTSVITNFI